MINKIKVAEWMSAPALSITPTTPVITAHQLMQDKHIRRLPVVKNEKVVGILTLGDIREAMPSDASSLSIWEENYLLEKLTAWEIMSRNVLTITPDDTIFNAAQWMLDNKISGLPVVERAGHLVGIITESDIFRMVIRLSADQPHVEHQSATS
jgi:acetoin utilization protein AcuB